MSFMKIVLFKRIIQYTHNKTNYMIIYCYSILKCHVLKINIVEKLIHTNPINKL